MALQNVGGGGEQELLESKLKPVFTSMYYSNPAYAQLAGNSAIEIKTGSEDGSEIGVFCKLKTPQRLSNLKNSLKEYLKFGHEAGIFFVT
jgi:hypothetical protein